MDSIDKKRSDQSTKDVEVTSDAATMGITQRYDLLQAANLSDDSKVAKATRGYPNIEEQRRAMRWPEQEANSDVEITSGNRQRIKK